MFQSYSGSSSDSVTSCFVSRWLVFSLVILSVWTATSSACGGCQHGETLLPNNIFGFCRCKCDPGFVGPQCQFPVGKRSSSKMIEDTLDSFYQPSRNGGNSRNQLDLQERSSESDFLWSLLLSSTQGQGRLIKRSADHTRRRK